MSNQIRIEQKEDKFAVLLVYDGSIMEMDVRKSYQNAEEFAFYLSGRIELDVYYKGQKINGK